MNENKKIHGKSLFDASKMSYGANGLFLYLWQCVTEFNDPAR